MVRYAQFRDYVKYRVGTDGSIWAYRSRPVPGHKWKRRKAWKKLNPHVGLYRSSVSLCKDGVAKTFHVHAVVLEAFKGPCPENMECRHLDNNGNNNVLSNLKWDTKVNNQADRVKYETDVRGEKHKLSKLTDSEVRRLRKMYATGNYSQTQLARIFGVNQPRVSLIIRRLAWPHVS